MSDRSTSGDWAVVLGVSVGTGASIARALADDPGLNIFGCHRGNHPGAADELAAAIERTGRTAWFRTGNAGTAEGAAEGAAALAERIGPGRVRLFVHSLASASIGRFTAADGRRLAPRQVHKTFDVMAHSFVFWVQQLLAHDLLAPGSRLLALTNPLDESLIRDCGLIAATKAALHGYVRALALELGPQGHRVNVLKFSTVITPAMRTVYGDDAIAQVERTHRRLLPAGRMCTTDEVGRVVSFLAGPDAEYFNGAVIDFSGGMTLGLADLVLVGDSAGP